MLGKKLGKGLVPMVPTSMDSKRSSRKIFLKTGGLFLQGRGKALFGIGSLLVKSICKMALDHTKELGHLHCEKFLRYWSKV
jgi:hypothetical protein